MRYKNKSLNKNSIKSQLNYTFKYWKILNIYAAYLMIEQ